ncbi:MAG: hypothetical protein JSV29_08045 [Candidatus Bathyarchaeota archaeon]|nr:MAG: hypothetical protein JSV29_08045 [Candidatus Bathyarchaeota archaeon]
MATEYKKSYPLAIAEQLAITPIAENTPKRTEVISPQTRAWSLRFKKRKKTVKNEKHEANTKKDLIITSKPYKTPPGAPGEPVTLVMKKSQR